MRTGLIRWHDRVEETARLGRRLPADHPLAVPFHDPPLAPRDEAVFLLHTAAEVEHALLVQYLYAAYSLGAPFSGSPPANAQQLVRSWRSTIISIALQEMGHLITVENLLRLIGGPLNFEREDFPFRSEFYPFHFMLEPLSKESLAKYIVAEMPDIPEPDAIMREIILRARASAGGGELNRVGALYWRIYHLFEAAADGSEDEHLSDSDFRPATSGYQAQPEHWPFHVDVIVRKVENRETALEAIRAIAEQGEGVGSGTAAEPSHFQLFLKIYDDGANSFPETDSHLGTIVWTATRPVPVNPSTRVEQNGSSTQTPIKSEPARLLSQLFNTRYRMLLTGLAHYLKITGDLGSMGQPTPRGLVRNICFQEMNFRMKPIAEYLTTIELNNGSTADGSRPVVGGAPFELDYTLSVPDDQCDLWRLHVDLITLSKRLIDALQSVVTDEDLRELLEEISSGDLERLELINEQIQTAC